MNELSFLISVINQLILHILYCNHVELTLFLIGSEICLNVRRRVANFSFILISS